MALMVSISGLRGIVGRSLTPEVIIRYAAAFAEYCARRSPGNPTVVLGGDGRSTGRMVTELAAGALLAKGMRVLTLGVCPTPTVQLAVEHERAAGGIAVTASHNPMEWNGLKFIAPTGMFLDGEENRQFWAIAGEEQTYCSWEGTGREVAAPGWLRKHVEAVLGLPGIDPPSVRRRRFTVVLDCINAAGGAIVPMLLEEFGCRVIPMNCELSGVFARLPEPVPELAGEAERRERLDARVDVVGHRAQEDQPAQDQRVSFCLCHLVALRLITESKRLIIRMNTKSTTPVATPRTPLPPLSTTVTGVLLLAIVPFPS